MNMKAKSLMMVMAAAVLMTAVSVSGAPFKDRIGFGVRGPVLAPLFKGTDFNNFGDSYQPFMMGWSGSFDLKAGLSDHIVLGLSYAYARTYDDSLSSDDQSFKMNNSDNAHSSLRGNLLSLTGSYYFRPDNKVQPFVLTGIGIDSWRLRNRTTNASDVITDLSLKLGAGVNVWLTEHLTFDVQGKLSYGITNLNSDVEAGTYGPGDWTDWDTRPFRGYVEPSIGLTWYLGGAPDTDEDGVNDKKDECPGTPFGALVDKQGCPLDGDGDGVFDGLDRCPGTPTGATVNVDGCPLDTDGDGVFDGLDKCPDTPADVDVDQLGCPFDTDEDGVPDYRDKEMNTPKGALVDADGVALDSDNDGVPDGLDKCTGSYAGAAVDPTGCPYDADQDGVADSVDNCLGTPLQVPVDEYGCPLAEKLTVADTVTLHITYASGSFEPDQTAKDTLDVLRERLRAYPETRIEVAGYTDNVGSEATNQTLSEKRAQAVVDYLVAAGVAPNRMQTVGHGETPEFFIGDNATPAGRRENRRVEIHVISQ